MSKHLFKRIVCICTVCALLLSATSFSAFARSLDDIQDDIDKYSVSLRTVKARKTSMLRSC